MRVIDRSSNTIALVPGLSHHDGRTADWGWLHQAQRDGLDRSLKRTMEVHSHRPNFAQDEGLSIQFRPIPKLRIGDTVIPSSIAKINKNTNTTEAAQARKSPFIPGLEAPGLYGLYM